MGTDDFAAFQDYLRSENYRELQKSLDRVREIRGIGMVQNLVFQGPFDLNTIR